MPGIADWLPYAQQVAQATGVLPGVLLALGLEETGLGTVGTGVLDNVWGIKYTGFAGSTEQAGGFAAYPTPAVAAQDMIRVLLLSNYAAVRSAQGAQAQIEALAASPYNGAPYAQRQQWAQTLLAVYASNDLSQYDGADVTPPAPPELPLSQFQVTAAGTQLTVTAPVPVMDGGAAAALVLVAAVALWLAEHL